MKSSLAALNLHEFFRGEWVCVFALKLGRVPNPFKTVVQDYTQIFSKSASTIVACTPQLNMGNSLLPKSV